MVLSRFPKKNPKASSNPSSSQSLTIVATKLIRRPETRRTSLEPRGDVGVAAQVCWRTLRTSSVLACLAIIAVTGSIGLAALQERGPSPTSADELRAAIGKLGDLDYSVRARACRVVRRAPATEAVPALLQAAREHEDGYIRFRALVLLTGFNDPRTADQMQEALASPNDRLREVAYGYFEHHPDRALAARFLDALNKENGEFVRPSLIRALAALGDDPKVQEALLVDVMRGVDFFRSTVIEALGDYKRTYAIPRLTEVAMLEGPLQDDAVLALGNLGEKQAMTTLANLQRTGSKALQPTVAAAICLLGVNCSSHIGYLEKILGFADDNPGYQDLVRPAAAGLGDIAVRGNAEALGILFEYGIPSNDPIRAPLALAVGKVALRNTPLMLEVLQKQKDQAGAISLLAEAFDMLEEDLEEEQFFVAVRRRYWAASESSPVRKLSEQLIGKLDF
jgi:HEAT repeat protein